MRTVKTLCHGGSIGWRNEGGARRRDDLSAELAIGVRRSRVTYTQDGFRERPSLPNTDAIMDYTDLIAKVAMRQTHFKGGAKRADLDRRPESKPGLSNS